MTVVEFIVDELNKEMGLISFVTGTEESYKSAIFSIIDQAKEMEKEQRIKDIDFGHGNPSWVDINYEAYFELSE